MQAQAPARLLDTLLRRLCRRLAESGGPGILIGSEEEPTLLEALQDVGLLTAAEPARATVCGGCEQACLMDVQFGCSGTPFVVCDKRDDIGRVPVAPEGLERWWLSADLVAAVCARLLEAGGAPERNAETGCWHIGATEAGGQKVDVCFAPILDTVRPRDGLIVTLAEPPEPRPGVIPFNRLVRFANGLLQIDRLALSECLEGRLHDERVVLEIVRVHSEIVLCARPTGQRRVLAKPNLNSDNDNAFQVLFTNPGRTYSVKELQAAAGGITVSDLHKLVENLGFRGDLRRLFFEVSKDAVRFRRTASAGTLALMGVDRGSLFLEAPRKETNRKSEP